MLGPMKHTWLKLLTSLLWSRKFRALPDNDHRMCYIGHLILQKIGLQNEEFCFISSTLFLSLRKYKSVRKELIRVELMDETGLVSGFEDSQLTPEAIRKRRQRSREKSRDNACDGHVTCHGDSRKQRAESRDKEEEGKRAGARNSPPSSAQKRMLEEMAQEKGVALPNVCRDLGIETMLRSDVSRLKDHLQALDLGDVETQETHAKNAALRRLKAELDEIHGKDGSASARAFIHDQDSKVQGGLWIRLTELESEIPRAEQEVGL